MQSRGSRLLHKAREARLVTDQTQVQGVCELQGKETGWVAKQPLIPKDVNKHQQRPDRERPQIPEIEIGAEKPRGVNVLYCTDVF